MVKSLGPQGLGQGCGSATSLITGLSDWWAFFFFFLRAPSEAMRPYDLNKLKKKSQKVPKLFPLCADVQIKTKATF